MKVSAIDENHDWTFGGNLSDYLDESAAIKQCVLTAILAVKTNWFLGLDDGVDWFGYFGRTSNLGLLENDLKSNILAVTGVYKIDNIDLNLDREKRHATIQIEYTDIFNQRIAVSTNVDN